MNTESPTEARFATERTRRAPTSPAAVVIRYDQSGEIGVSEPTGSIDLTLETTDADGNIAAWCTDGWWTGLFHRWGDADATVRIAPTPAALLHPVLLHQLEMIRRIAPHWRAVGHGYRNDLSTERDFAELAGSAYHEVRLIDDNRPRGTGRPPQGSTIPIEETIRRVREQQIRIGAATPVLVRLPAMHALPKNSGSSEPVFRKANASPPAGAEQRGPKALH